MSQMDRATSRLTDDCVERTHWETIHMYDDHRDKDTRDGRWLLWRTSDLDVYHYIERHAPP